MGKPPEIACFISQVIQEIVLKLDVGRLVKLR